MNQVLTLDQGGRPSRWTPWREALTYKIKGLIAWSLGDEVAYRGGTCRLTGEETVVYLPNIIAIANEVFDGRVALTNHNLFARDNWTCSYCGLRFPASELTREHIIPRARGGPNSWSNCTSSCRSCNTRKGCLTPDEAGMPLLWVPYVPNKAEELILSRRGVLPDQREYLRDCLPKASPLRSRFPVP